MRLSSVAIAVIVALSAVPTIAAEPTRPTTADEGFVIREAIRAEPVALSVLTDGLVTDGAATSGKDRGLEGWRKREAQEAMREALEEAIDMAREAERF